MGYKHYTSASKKLNKSMSQNYESLVDHVLKNTFIAMTFCAWYFVQGYVHWVVSRFISENGRLPVKPCN